MKNITIVEILFVIDDRKGNMEIQSVLKMLFIYIYYFCLLFAVY